MFRIVIMLFNLIFLFTGHVFGIIFRDSRSGLFLGFSNDKIVMTPYPVESMDISVQTTEPPSISTILSLGTKALSILKNSHKIDIVDMQRNEKTQFFKIVLVDRDRFVLQHNDLCVGYSNFFSNSLPETENLNLRTDAFPKVEMVDCGDNKNVITFLKSERIDGEIRERKMISYVEPLELMNPYHLDPYPNHLDHHGITETIDIKKYHQDVIKPEETGFLMGVPGRVNHLY